MNIPRNINAEMSVLGSMLLDDDALEYCVDMLSRDDFHEPANGELFTAICALNAKGHQVDVVALASELAKAGRLDDVGGVAYITDLTIKTPSSANVKYYAGQVEECAMRRKIMKAGHAMVSRAQDEERPIAETLANAEKYVYEMSIRKGQDTLIPAKDMLISAYETLDETTKRKGAMMGVQTGFIDLDRVITGFKNSDLVIIAGRPAMGKTAFAINIVQFATLTRNKSVAVFSLEMSSERLMHRMFAAVAKKDLRKMLSGELSQEDLSDIAVCTQRFQDAKLFIDDSPIVTIPSIRSKCRKLKARHGLDMVVIDYLQLMKSPNKTYNREQEIADITRSAKLMAKELNVPVVLLSQLSRAPEKRGSNTPVLSDLRESGAIEQDADIVIFLYREMYEGNNVADVIVAKNRDGPTGIINLTWIGAHTTFMNYTEG